MWGKNWKNWKQKYVSWLLWLETSTLLYLKWTSSGGKKSVRTDWSHQHHQSAGYKGHQETASSNKGRIHILLKHTWIFTKTDHISSHKIHINIFKIIEIIQCLLSNHNETKPEINNGMMAGKSSNTWRLNNTL